MAKSKEMRKLEAQEKKLDKELLEISRKKSRLDKKIGGLTATLKLVKKDRMTAKQKKYWK